MQKIYDFKAFSSRGKEIDFSQFQGKVLLIVNTASKCGFTPQFAGLDCQVNYGVTFQIMRKGDVNGKEAQPIFEYLKAQAPTEEYKGLKAKATRTLLKTLSKSVEKDSDILWNFTKFLISKDGETIKRFAPTAEPKNFEKDIEEMLG